MTINQQLQNRCLYRLVPLGLEKCTDPEDDRPNSLKYNTIRTLLQAPGMQYRLCGFRPLARLANVFTFPAIGAPGACRRNPRNYMEILTLTIQSAKLVT